MSEKVCPSCHSTQFQTDTSNNEVVCGNCFRVMEESQIVSEVTFGENSSGAAVVTGSFVGADQAHVSSGRGPHGHQSESRLQTIEKTRHRMSRISSLLDIEDHVQERALQYFKLALSHNFVKGRKSTHVVCACLYVACRLKQTTHMLMDFAEAIYTNVFAIGATYLQLVKVLCIKGIPLVDPSIFIRRFVSKLSFGEEGAKKVMDDANRLAHRMNRDWLVQGRRPAGIAASCVLLAARMNNFRRSKAEIVQVAKIAEETVQRRLDEFGSTSAGTLTVSDFRSTQIESEADPPSFMKHREKERRLAAAAQHVDLEGTDEEMEFDPELDTIIKDLEEQDRQARIQKKREEEEGAKRKKEEEEDEQKDTEDDKEPTSTSKDNDGDVEISKEIDNTLEDPEFKEISRAQLLLRKYREQKEIEANPQKSSWASTISDDPFLLSDVDDDEIESFILDEDERKVKEQIWMTLNRDYLIEQEKKRLKMEADVKAGIYKAPRKRRRGKPKEEQQEDEAMNAATGGGESSNSVSTPVEGAKKMLQTRTFSKKLNYDAMNALFKNRRSQG